jgi:hypothetical protein
MPGNDIIQLTSPLVQIPNHPHLRHSQHDNGACKEGLTPRDLTEGRQSTANLFTPRLLGHYPISDEDMVQRSIVDELVFFRLSMGLLGGVAGLPGTLEGTG